MGGDGGGGGGGGVSESDNVILKSFTLQPQSVFFSLSLEVFAVIKWKKEKFLFRISLFLLTPPPLPHSRYLLG